MPWKDERSDGSRSSDCARTRVGSSAFRSFHPRALGETRVLHTTLAAAEEASCRATRSSQSTEGRRGSYRAGRVTRKRRALGLRTVPPLVVRRRATLACATSTSTSGTRAWGKATIHRHGVQRGRTGVERPRWTTACTRTQWGRGDCSDIRKSQGLVLIPSGEVPEVTQDGKLPRSREKELVPDKMPTRISASTPPAYLQRTV